MKLYQSIFLRKSVRNYEMKALDFITIDKIKSYQEKVLPYNKELKVRMEIIDCMNSKAKVGGAFTVKAPYYLAFYSTEHEDKYINAGYMLEQMVLYMHSEGLGTCYLGNGKVNEVSGSGDGGLVIIAAFGKPREALSRDKDDAKRHELHKICTFKDEMNKTAKDLLEAAQIAPSSMNSQPWHFLVYDNRIHVFMQKGKLIGRFLAKWNEIDMGIVLSHMMTASDALWLEAAMKKREQAAEQEVPNKKYITTIGWK